MTPVRMEKTPGAIRTLDESPVAVAIGWAERAGIA